MRKLNISVIVGIIVALIGAGLVFAYGRNVNHKIAGGKQTVGVLVANRALTAGMTASDVASHVHLVQIPSAYVVTGALTDESALHNATAQTAVLVGAVPQGGQLSFSNFEQGAAAGRVQPSKGNVALSIETPLSSGVARYLQPGQTVDMFVTYQEASNSSGAAGSNLVNSRTKLFASGVKVLSVSIAQATTGNATSETDQSTTPTGNVVALLDLDPRTAEKVVNATTLGSIYLAYAPASATTPKGATPASVLKSNR